MAWKRSTVRTRPGPPNYLTSRRNCCFVFRCTLLLPSRRWTEADSVERAITGGKNAAYYVNTTNNASVYRTSDTIGIEVTSDTGGDYDVGNTEPGEWLNYTVNIATAQTYTLHVRVASGVPDGSFHLACDGRQVTPSISVPLTGGWQTWQTVDVPGVQLPAGMHALQLIG